MTTEEVAYAVAVIVCRMFMVAIALIASINGQWGITLIALVFALGAGERQHESTD